jgi:hypothetical protein
MLEYISNRLKWDNIFCQKENRAKYDKPVKQKDVATAAAVEKINGDGQHGLFKEKKPDPSNIINRSLMRKVWGIYNPKLEAEDKKTVDENAEIGDNQSIQGAKNGENQSGTGSQELSADTSAVRAGGSEGAGDLNVPGAGEASNQGESGGVPVELGGSLGRDIRGRRGRSSIKEVRERIKKLLAEKSDGEMTDADKELLRQYEGGGGLAEKDATTHGTLYEFYTPQKVVDKVWAIVDKYNPRTDKTVIEPSAGTGRFAENRLEKFDLFELDETSARIAGILHPDANLTQGYFQDQFMNGNTPKKSYTGKKYDVAIGNPPYGAYSGKHKGLGEGKEHTRIEEYFIDRSLDTLRDGGILAMVVPSSFLRGKNSKAKMQIAKKAKLLESWRLPNGTFGTTGVGTDIIILRKEPGDVMDFSNDIYFQGHEDQIAGVECEKMGRFGMEKYVAPPDGMTFDEALDSINPGHVANVIQGEKSPAEAANQDVTASVTDIKEGEFVNLKLPGGKSKLVRVKKVHPAKGNVPAGVTVYDENGKNKTVFMTDIEKVESDAEKHDNRSQAMMGNDNAYKGGPKDGVIGGRIAVLEAEIERMRPIAADNDQAVSEGKTVWGADSNVTGKYVAEKEAELSRLQNDSTADTSKRLIEANNKRIAALKESVEDSKKRIASGALKGKQLASIKNANKNCEDQIYDLEAENKKISEEEASRNRSEAMMGNDNAAGSGGGEQQAPARKKKSSTDDYIRSIGKNMSVNEYNERYGVLVDKKDLAIWAATDFSGRIDVSKLSKKDREHLHNSGNFTVDANGVWYSIANYASGNIYDKLDQLEADKERIIANMGQKVYDFNKGLLEAARLPPKAAENIHVSPISDFVKEYMITDEDGGEINLVDAFKQWAGVSTHNYGRRSWSNWDSDDSPISEHEIPAIISFNDVIAYINQEPQKTDKATAREFDKLTAKMEAAKKREARRECAERLFNRFIREGMTEDRRKALIDTWNRRYNSVVNPDYQKIPVFIDGMNTHKGEKDFNLIKEQVETASFMCNKGNGISAAEVGVGKTVIGECVAIHTIKAGRAKRPFIPVPKSVYSKWIKEFHQHFPDVVVNELGNFSDKDIARYKNADGTLNIPEGSVSVCTYEALQKITFKDETIETDLIDDMMDSQTIYDAEAQEKRSPKELAEERNKMMERLGKGAKAKEGAIFWEDTGFDCVIVDEIHNFKNVFGQTRSFSTSAKDKEGNERQSNEFKGLTGGESDRAMKLFAITQLIQKQNNGRNVFGLSATPFTNSPIEVYNMLSLVARNKLKELHIYNMYEFLAQFAEIKTEYSVDAKGEIVEKEVMKNWKNLGALQNLISEYMDHVEADKAGVIRPRKKVHLPQLELTPLQRAIIKAETQYMTDADPREDPGATLKAINNMRMATLTPAAINPSRWEFYQGEYPELFKGMKFPASKDFVSASPKMKFVCDSVSKAYKKMPDAGQIIYLPRGVNDFVHVKQYLMDQGMPADSIAFMSSATTLDQKEQIKADFNDKNGKIKVIIGSETIKEGVSLNGNTTTIYNCMLGWNPTETIQVEGRAWRQGNEQGHVHIVYPLMADSIDSLMYQKYDEKSSRINEIWNYKGDTSSDVSDIDPESLKFDLIKDPAKKAGFIVGQKRDKIKSDRRIEEARYDVLAKDQGVYGRAIEALPSQKRDMDTAEAEMLDYRKKRDEAQKKLEKAKKSEDRAAIMDATRELNHEKWELDNATSSYRNEKKAYKELSDRVAALEAKFKRLDIKPEKIDDKLKEISAGIQKLKADEDAINNSYETELKKAKKELEAQKQKFPPLSEMIDDNIASIMGDLRSMKYVKEEIKTERGYTEGTISRKEAIDNLVSGAGLKPDMAKEMVDKWDRERGVKKSFVISNGRLLARVS